MKATMQIPRALRASLPALGRIWFVLLALIIAGAGYLVYQRTTARSTPAAELTTVPVRRGQIAATVNAAGSVVITRQAKLTFTSGGRLKEVLVEVGQRVSAGQKLAQLDTSTLEIKLEQAKSSLRSAQLKLEQLKAPARPEEIAAARAALESAQAKYNELMAEPTEEELKAAEQSIASAQAALEKARTELAKLQAGPSEDEIVTVKAALEKAQIALQKAQGDYDRVAWRNDAMASAQAAALQQATIDYQVALANYNAKTAPAKPEDIAAAQRNVESAEAALAAAQAKLDRLRAGPKPADIEAARSAVANAQAQLALKLAGPTESDVALAEEQVRQAELSVRAAERDLLEATLIAPFDGVIAAIGANPGEQVGANTAVITLLDPQALRVDVNVDETDVPKVALGKRAMVSFDAIPDKRFTGKVIAIAPIATVQQGVVTYQVSIGLDRVDTTIPAGLTASANIVIDQKDNVLMVPNRAIRTQGRDRTVQVMVDGKPETRVVRIGMSNDQFTEVVEGLKEGDQVVIPATTTAAPRIGAFGVPGGGAAPLMPR